MNVNVNDAYLCGLGYSDYLKSTNIGPLTVKLEHKDYLYFKDKIDPLTWEPSLVVVDSVFLKSKDGILSSVLDIIASESTEAFAVDIFLHFLAGLINRNSTWTNVDSTIFLIINTYHPCLKNRLHSYLPTYHFDYFNNNVSSVTFYGLGLTDIFGSVISAVSPNMVNEQCLYKYYEHVGQFRHDGRLVGFSWSKLLPNAVPPEKHHSSDSGFDLTLIREVSKHGNLTFYGTGIGVTTAYGWYFQLVPRSSLAKRGYMLANSVGIIDQSYRGEIMAPLVKIDPEAAPLTLPCRCLQIVPAPVVHFDFPQVDNFSKTTRNSDGFGSTGV